MPGYPWTGTNTRLARKLKALNIGDSFRAFGGNYKLIGYYPDAAQWDKVIVLEIVNVDGYKPGTLMTNELAWLTYRGYIING